MDASTLSGDKTISGVIVAGVIALGVGIRKFFLWIFNVKVRLDNHDKLLDDMYKKIFDHLVDESKRNTKMDELSDRMARMETKIDLLIEDKIK